MADDLTRSMIMRLLSWAYDAALTGYPSISSARELADEYRAEPGAPRDQANALIRWQIAKTASSGFLTGLGGLITIPITMPADLGTAYFVQLRMVAAIAFLGGYDARSQPVRTLSYVCLLGSAASELLSQLASDLGAQLGERISASALQKLSSEIAATVDEKVSARLLAGVGEHGLAGWGRAIPLLGGLFTAGLNGVLTNEIGDAARDLFLPERT